MNKPKLKTETRQMLEPLPRGEPFPMNYERARIDRNALFSLNQVFDPGLISDVRTKYHRSSLNFSDLKKNLLEYNKPRPIKHPNASYYMAYESVRRDLGLYKTKVIPLTTGAVANHPDLPGAKSPGLPYKIRGYNTKKDAISDPAVLAEIRQLWYDVETGKDVVLADVACYARSHIATRDKNKIRATWGYPLEVYMQEASYFYPILDVLKETDNPLIAYGIEIGNGGMSYINRMAEAFPTRPVLLGDWSGFDHTLPAWLIRDAFSLIAEGIDWTKVLDSTGKTWPVRENRSKKRWRKMIDYFIDTPIRLSNGERFIKHCGVPSGSCWTNVIDSIVNALVMRYAIYELTGRHPLADAYLGDDSVVVLPCLIDLEILANFCKEQFGMVFNHEKSHIVHDRNLIHFLGYYNNSGTPWKPIDTIIASTIYPEHTVFSKIDTISRLIGQAYSCFSPDEATLFVKAAHILMDEEQISSTDLDKYISDHPERYKYLSILGLDPTKLGVPNICHGAPTWRTLPNQNRRVWSFKDYNEEELFQLGILHYFNIVDET